MSDIKKNCDIRIRNLMEYVGPVLSPQAKAVFAKQRIGSSPDMFMFGCIHHVGQMDEMIASYQDFGKRINHLVSMFDGKRRHPVIVGEGPLADGQCRPSLEACLSYPMEVPLSSARSVDMNGFMVGKQDHRILWAFLFIYDVPFYISTFSPDGHQKNIDWINSITGNVLRAHPEGTIPANPSESHPDFPVLPKF